MCAGKVTDESLTASRICGCNSVLHKLPGAESHVSGIPSCQTYGLPLLLNAKFFIFQCSVCLLSSCFTLSWWVLFGKIVMHGLEGVTGAAFNAALQYRTHYVERCFSLVELMTAPDILCASIICVRHPATSCCVQASEATLESRCFSAS